MIYNHFSSSLTRISNSELFRQKNVKNIVYLVIPHRQIQDITQNQSDFLKKTRGIYQTIKPIDKVDSKFVRQGLCEIYKGMRKHEGYKKEQDNCVEMITQCLNCKMF